MTPRARKLVNRSPAQIARAQAWLAAERCRPTPGSSSRSRYYNTSLLLQLRDRRRYRHKSPANSTFANLAPRTFSSRLGTWTSSASSRRRRSNSGAFWAMFGSTHGTWHCADVGRDDAIGREDFRCELAATAQVLAGAPRPHALSQRLSHPGFDGDFAVPRVRWSRVSGFR